jgi:N-succinyl-L-ornithine transcarbamylase
MYHFRSIADVPNLEHLLQQAFNFKKLPQHGERLGKGKTLGLVFFNPSTRTRISTQIAAQNLGMKTVVYNPMSEGWPLEMEENAVMNGTSVEHIRDVIPVLGAYFDIIALRSFPSLQNKEEDEEDKILQNFVNLSQKPVLSLESATLHPLQSLADLMTIQEHFKLKRKPRIALTWAPHIKPVPHCVANSFAQWINAFGEADFTIAQPPGYELDPVFTGNAKITHNQSEAITNADFIYVKSWSATQPYGKMICTDPDWMLNEAKLAHNPLAKTMHCLPVRRDVEIGADLLEGKRSLVTQQAANRVWAAQAVLGEILLNL